MCPRFLYNTPALQQLVSALTMPLWIGIPVVQILFAVFPWDVNGWFGAGFLAYYVFASPLLFQVRSITFRRTNDHYFCFCGLQISGSSVRE